MRLRIVVSDFDMREALHWIMVCALLGGCHAPMSMQSLPELAQATEMEFRPRVRREDQPFSFGAWRIERIELDQVRYRSQTMGVATYLIARREYQFTVRNANESANVTCSMSARHVVKQDVIDRVVNWLVPEVAATTWETLGSPALSCEIAGDSSGSLRLQQHVADSTTELSGEAIFDDRYWALHPIAIEATRDPAHSEPLGYELRVDGKPVAAMLSIDRARVRFSDLLDERQTLGAAAVFAAIALFDPDRLDPPD